MSLFVSVSCPPKGEGNRQRGTRPACTGRLPVSQCKMRLKPTNILESIQSRRESCRSISELLFNKSLTIDGQNAELLVGLSKRIEYCNRADNIWFAKATADTLVNKSFTPSGRLWRCNSKLCSDCLAHQSQRNRKQLRELIKNVQLEKNERWYFVTFTIPNPDLLLVEVRSIVNRAWELFRKRKMSVALFRGGSKSEEFTITPNGIHYHLHCLFVSKWMQFNECRRNWSECVETSFAEHERIYKCPTSDGMLQVKIKTVQPTMSCINELCKYVTKSNSWKSLPINDLIEIAKIRRWNRMFEMFGCLAVRNLGSETAIPPIVHTRLITDAKRRQRPSYWMDQVEFCGVVQYLSDLRMQISRRRLDSIIEISSFYSDRHLIILNETFSASNCV